MIISPYSYHFVVVLVWFPHIFIHLITGNNDTWEYIVNIVQKFKFWLRTQFWTQIIKSINFVFLHAFNDGNWGLNYGRLKFKEFLEIRKAKGVKSIKSHMVLTKWPLRWSGWQPRRPQNFLQFSSLPFVHLGG